MSDSCVFCNLIRNKKEIGEDSIISETEGFLAVLDRFPVSDGHILLISKKHLVDVTEVDNES